MAQRNRNHKLSEQDKREIKELYSIDRVKYTKYRLAVMYGVSWGAIHYVIDEEARLKNVQQTKERNQRKRNEEM